MFPPETKCLKGVAVGDDRVSSCFLTVSEMEQTLTYQIIFRNLTDTCGTMAHLLFVRSFLLLYLKGKILPANTVCDGKAAAATAAAGH